MYMFKQMSSVARTAIIITPDLNCLQMTIQDLLQNPKHVKNSPTELIVLLAGMLAF